MTNNTLIHTECMNSVYVKKSMSEDLGVEISAVGFGRWAYVGTVSRMRTPTPTLKGEFRMALGQ